MTYQKKQMNRAVLYKPEEQFLRDVDEPSRRHRHRQHAPPVAGDLRERSCRPGRFAFRSAFTPERRGLAAQLSIGASRTLLPLAFAV
jgi:hypothetical protein